MKFNLFQLIDLDRTLFDTSRFIKAITDEIDLQQPGLGTELDERFEDAYTKEETFFLMRYLRQEKGDAWFEALVDVVARKYGGESFLIDGARERLAFADTISDDMPAWGILTYGDEVDQRLKMRLIGLENAPVYFTPRPEKGEMMQAWKQADGTFLLPASLGGRRVERLTFEDDKFRAFEDVPDTVIGIWISAPGKQNHGQGITLPANVHVSQTLFQSVELLKTLL